MKKLLAIFGLLLMVSASGRAACTGSGLSWACPAGASISDVQTAINSATDGATITFAAGSYTWGSQARFSASAGVTLTCVSVGGCPVSVTGGPVLGVAVFSGTNTHFYRISGFTFNQSVSGEYVIWFGSACSGCNGVFTQIRIDNSTFNLTDGSVGILFGENSSIGNFYGVIDHNTFNSSTSSEALYMLGTINPTPPASPIGTANNMFFETNVISITTMTNAGLGCMDGWGSDAIVWRYNVSTNCLVTAHGVTHNGGPTNIELYNNTIQVNAGAVSAGFADCYRCFHHQGSAEFIGFNNVFTAYSGKNSEVISMLHYRDYPNGIDGALPADAAQCNGSVNGPADAPYIIDGNRAPPLTYQGYNCWRQPGRDAATGNLVPMYVWNDYWSDTGAQIPLVAPDEGGTPDYYSQHMKANREWYNAVSNLPQSSPTVPFNGTTGMGFGTFANRPPTCTPSVEAGGGVAYFAQDVGAQGTLYRCSAANTWTVQYTPYIYPHPLVTGGQPVPHPLFMLSKMTMPPARPGILKRLFHYLLGVSERS